jgi:hypothetical protein
MASPRITEGFRVLIALDSFWTHLDNVRGIGVLQLVLRGDIEPAFAVAHTPSARDKLITKAWAKRWLGLSLSWLTKCPKLTLARGLKIVMEHGGLAATRKRAVKQQALDAAVVRDRAEKADEKARRKQHNDKLFKDILQWRTQTDAVPREFYYGLRKYMQVIRQKQTFEAVVEELTRIYKQDMSARQQRREQVTRFNQQLKAEGLPCTGVYYNECINGGVELNDAAIAEVRFRNELWDNKAYDQIVKRLAAANGGFFRGIHAAARTIFRRRFTVDATGRIGAENLDYDMTRDLQELGDNSEEEEVEDDEY